MFERFFSRGKRADTSPVSLPKGGDTSEIPGHIGNRRKTSWWEPIYAPDITLVQEPYDWDLDRDAGPHRRYISGVTLTKKLSAGETFTIRRATFRECDFQGMFRGDPIVMFDECQFINCDFAYSSWIGGHFKNCIFTDSSIALAAFEKCEFRDCRWERVGVASKTEFTRTFVSDPGALVRAMVSRTNPGIPTRKHRANQWYRLASTRAHVLRSLLLSHSMVGDEHIYYRIVRLHELQRYCARMAENAYDILHARIGRKILGLLKLPFHALNFMIMTLLGLTNGWGESVSQPCAFFVGIFGVFGLIYTHAPFSTAIAHPFQKSFDITLLVGYGNQSAGRDLGLTLVQDLHAAVSVIVYTVFFSTMISKLSRAR